MLDGTWYGSTLNLLRKKIILKKRRRQKRLVCFPVQALITLRIKATSSSVHVKCLSAVFSIFALNTISIVDFGGKTKVSVDEIQHPLNNVLPLN